MVADRKPAIGGRLLDDAKRFVAEDQALFAGGCAAVLGRDDLSIGAADAEGQRPHQKGAACGIRLRHVV
jgi:hypothetical protein